MTPLNERWAALGLTGGARVVAVSHSGETREAFEARIKGTDSPGIWNFGLYFDSFRPVQEIMNEYPLAWWQFVTWFQGSEGRIQFL